MQYASVLLGVRIGLQVDTDRPVRKLDQSVLDAVRHAVASVLVLAEEDGELEIEVLGHYTDGVSVVSAQLN